MIRYQSMPVSTTTQSRFIIVALLLGLLLLTNRYFSYEKDHDFVLFAATDSVSYMGIARAAPKLPDQEYLFPHAQRFFIPYSTGIVAHILGLPEELMFRIFGIMFIIIILSIMHKIFTRIGLNDNQYTLCMSILILNTYAYRYYIASPMIITDLGFECGFATLFYGLFSKNFRIVALGAIVAALSRQTALLLIPGVFLWMLYIEEWKTVPLKQRMTCTAITAALIVGIYVITGQIGAKFADSQNNLSHILLGFSTYYSGTYSLTYILIVYYRSIIGYLLPLGVMFGIHKSMKREATAAFNAQFGLCWIFILIIYLHSVLMGPITGPNITRYCMYSYFLLIVALAIKLHQTKAFSKVDPRTMLLTGAILFLSSCHHMYFFTGSRQNSNVYFAMIFTICAFLLSGITWWNTRDTKQRDV